MRFFGAVGYGESIEEPEGSGVWIDSITEVEYYGDVIRNMRRLTETEFVSDDLSVDNSISIIADDYAVAHFHQIKYLIWEGAFWTVTSVEVRSPRLILSLGGVYNGPTL